MKIKPNQKLREITGEKIVVINGPTGVDLTKVVMLNKSAELLWNSLKEKEFCERDVIDILIQEYNIDKEQADSDRRKWIESMEKVGLIER